MAERRQLLKKIWTNNSDLVTRRNKLTSQKNGMKRRS